MKPSRWIVLALALCSVGAGSADAQVLSRLPLVVHARVGAGLPTGGFAEQTPGIGAEPGTAFELGGILRATSWLGVYAGYQQERFGCAGCASVNTDGTAVTTGVEVGGHVTLPVERFGIRPWVRGGVVRHTLRFSRGESSLVSEPGIGIGVGGGVQLPVGAILLTPGVRFQMYPVEVEFSGYPSRSLDVSQLTVDLGLLLPF